MNPKGKDVLLQTNLLEKEIRMNIGPCMNRNKPITVYFVFGRDKLIIDSIKNLSATEFEKKRDAIIRENGFAIAEISWDLLPNSKFEQRVIQITNDMQYGLVFATYDDFPETVFELDMKKPFWEIYLEQYGFFLGEETKNLDFLILKKKRTNPGKKPRVIEKQVLSKHVSVHYKAPIKSANILKQVSISNTDDQQSNVFPLGYKDYVDQKSLLAKENINMEKNRNKNIENKTLEDYGKDKIVYEDNYEPSVLDSIIPQPKNISQFVYNSGTTETAGVNVPKYILVEVSSGDFRVYQCMNLEDQSQGDGDENRDKFNNRNKNKSQQSNPKLDGTKNQNSQGNQNDRENNGDSNKGDKSEENKNSKENQNENSEKDNKSKEGGAQPGGGDKNSAMSPGSVAFGQDPNQKNGAENKKNEDSENNENKKKDQDEDSSDGKNDSDDGSNDDQDRDGDQGSQNRGSKSGSSLLSMPNTRALNRKKNWVSLLKAAKSAAQKTKKAVSGSSSSKPTDLI